MLLTVNLLYNLLLQAFDKAVDKCVVLQASHTEWLKSFMAGVAPSQEEAPLQRQNSDSEPFPGFPAAGCS